MMPFCAYCEFWKFFDCLEYFGLWHVRSDGLVKQALLVVETRSFGDVSLNCVADDDTETSQLRSRQKNANNTSKG